MAKTRTWFEGELRRLLGFDEVEEIATFALDSFRMSAPSELRQYLEQFLGQSKEVEKLCAELSARLEGDSTTISPRATNNALSASDDFWRGGAGSRAGSSASKSSAGLLVAGAGAGPRGQPAGLAAGKSTGKVYQKAAAEEDFWGGGTRSGRSKATSTPAKSGRTSVCTAAAAIPAQTTAKVAPALAPAAVAGNARKGKEGSWSNTKGGVGGVHLAVPTAVTTSTKKHTPKQPPATAKAIMKNSGSEGDRRKVAPPPPPAAEVIKDATAMAAPKWSGVTCLCMGKTHDVVTNCMSCGKIACVKEGGFGCSFCGSALPSTGREPHKIVGTDPAAFDKPSTEPPQSAALAEALKRKDRLLLFDRTSASRTKVLDDQGDYFTSHNWLSQGEREKGEAEEKARRDDAASKRGARRQVKMSIDIMGRRVIETQEAAVEGKGKGGDETENASVTEGISLDFGSSSPERGGRGDGGGGGGSGDGGPTEVESQRAVSVGNYQRVSLENTGLRGRAREVYDVMRANLEKKNRRRHGGAGGRMATGNRGKTAAVPEESRLSLWRVQHDVDSDDLLRQSQTESGGGGGGVIGGFEPTGSVTCAR